MHLHIALLVGIKRKSLVMMIVRNYHQSTVRHWFNTLNEYAWSSENITGKNINAWLRYLSATVSESDQFAWLDGWLHGIPTHLASHNFPMCVLTVFINK